jgi:hypothetical protein
MTYDLSTSGKCGTNYVIPEVRSGHVRIRILWSEPLPIDLTMVMYCKFPSTLYLNKENATSSNLKVTSSYTAR